MSPMLFKSTMNHHSESGQSLVEFALLFGLMLLTMLVFISLSLTIYYQIQLTRLTHDIARISSLAEFEQPTDTQRKIDELINRYAQTSAFSMNLTDYTVFQYQITETPFPNGLEVIEVRIQYAGLVFPMVGNIQNRTYLAYPKTNSLPAP